MTSFVDKPIGSVLCGWLRLFGFASAVGCVILARAGGYYFPDFNDVTFTIRGNYFRWRK
jgi:hypothetical protein